jgi:hypothetical protein
MPLESTYNGIQDLNPSWPTGTDPKSQGDDHMRAIKQALQQSFPVMTGAWQTTSKIKCEGLDVSGERIENVGASVDATDAARKGDVDAINNRLTPAENELVRLGDVTDDNKDQIEENQQRIGALEQQQGISSFGAVGAQGGSGSGGSRDWSVSKIATGKYRLVFSAAAGGLDKNILVATCIDPNSQDAVLDVSNISSTTVEVRTYRNSSAADIGFNFIRLRT